MTNEAALFNILIFDFIAQILSIFLLCAAQLVIDIDSASNTDRMNELKYQMKIIMVIFNTTISNCITTSYIENKGQLVNTSITKKTNNIDQTLLVLFVIALAYAIKLKIQKKQV